MFSRKVEVYPLTILEIHTLFHVTCALLIYGIYFKKPVDIMSPTIIEEDSEVDAGSMRRRRMMAMVTVAVEVTVKVTVTAVVKLSKSPGRGSL